MVSCLLGSLDDITEISRQRAGTPAAVVEDRRLRIVLRGFTNDFDQRLGRQRRAVGQLVQRIDIGLVMFAVMELERLGRHDRLERVLGIRQGGKFKSHSILTLCLLSRRHEKTDLLRQNDTEQDQFLPQSSFWTVRKPSRLRLERSS